MRPLKTRFRSAYTYRLKLARKTNSLTHYTKGTPSPARRRRADRGQISDVRCQKGAQRRSVSVICSRSSVFCPLTFGERAPTDCRHSVSGSISLPSSGCFSPFPHGTRSLSVAKEYLGLEGGPPTFRQDFTCPALLKDPNQLYPYGALTLSGPAFQPVPVCQSGPLAWSAFARHY